jgi:hypothetical protein
LVIIDALGMLSRHRAICSGCSIEHPTNSI